MSRTTIALVVLILFAAAGAAWWSGPTVDGLAERVSSLRSMGWWGLAVFLVLYAAGTWLMVPASWLQGAAGFLYGPVVGIGLAWAASTGFGAVSFLLARGRLRETITPWIGGGRLSALDEAFAERGTSVVALLRLSPISPYNPLCYALGLTSVRPGAYLVGSAVGALVPTAVWGLVGASLGDLSAMADAGAAAPWSRFAVIALTLVASVGIARFVKGALGRASADPVPTPT